jgi:hypothetical protein
MTPWCTPADLVASENDLNLLAGLAGPTDWEPVSGAQLRTAVADPAAADPATTLAVERLARACAEANAITDGHLAARWPNGLDPVPAIVRSAAVGLALEDMLGARHGDPSGPFAGWIRRAATARKTLAALRDGALTLGLPAVSTPSAIRYQAAERLVTADTLAGMG